MWKLRELMPIIVECSFRYVKLYNHIMFDEKKISLLRNLDQNAESFI